MAMRGVIINGLLILMFVIAVIYHLSIKEQPPRIKHEYILELVDQNTIKVWSVSNHKLYTCEVDSLVIVLEQDNL